MPDVALVILPELEKLDGVNIVGGFVSADDSTTVIVKLADAVFLAGVPECVTIWESGTLVTVGPSFAVQVIVWVPIGNEY